MGFDTGSFQSKLLISNPLFPRLDLRFAAQIASTPQARENIERGTADNEVVRGAVQPNPSPSPYQRRARPNFGIPSPRRLSAKAVNHYPWSSEEVLSAVRFWPRSYHTSEPVALKPKQLTLLGLDTGIQC